MYPLTVPLYSTSVNTLNRLIPTGNEYRAVINLMDVHNRIFCSVWFNFFVAPRIK